MGIVPLDQALGEVVTLRTEVQDLQLKLEECREHLEFQGTQADAPGAVKSAGGDEHSLKLKQHLQALQIGRRETADKVPNLLTG